MQFSMRQQSEDPVHKSMLSKMRRGISNINLTNIENWVDLIAWDTVDFLMDNLVLQPYQCVWLTNKT